MVNDTNVVVHRGECVILIKIRIFVCVMKIRKCTVTKIYGIIDNYRSVIILIKKAIHMIIEGASILRILYNIIILDNDIFVRFNTYKSLSFRMYTNFTKVLTSTSFFNNIRTRY